MNFPRADDSQPVPADGHQPPHTSSEWLALALVQLGSTRGRDELATVCLEFAARIAECSGLLLIPQANSESIFLRGQPADRAALRDYASRIAGSARRSPVVAVEEGAAFSSLIVPVASERFEAIAFVWLGAYPLTPDLTALLRALAAGFASALRLDQALDDRARSYAHFRGQVEDLKHRLRNILAFVRSIVRRTMQSSLSFEEFAIHLESRIGAVSRIQATLHSVGGTGVELQDLIHGELLANAIDESRFTIAGPAIRLRARAAETLALAIHELTTNSLKFGTFASNAGHVEIIWSIQRDKEDPPWLQFEWIERDVAIASAAPRHRGFGTELIEKTVQYELGGVGQLSFTPGGIECRIELPLSAQNASSIHRQPRPRST